MPRPASIGIDTGGTFTDVARRTRDGLQILKVPSTPDAPEQAVLDGLGKARKRPEEPIDLVHGTTVGLNAILTGNLARTALVTNAGFEDLVEIGRQERPDLYSLEPHRTPFPVPRELRFGIAVRRDAAGRKVLGFAPGALDDLCLRLGRARIESVAICLLHSPLAPADEQRIARALRPLGVPITCSAELAPVHGEFERFSAAVINAALHPLMGGYMERLRAGAGAGTVHLMRSSAGIMGAEEAADFPARAVFSGPAGGVLATARLAKALGLQAVAGLDMGGTSTDVCLTGPDAGIRQDAHIAGLPLPLPAVDVHTIGTGGGSLAHADPGGSLRVGPQSAGADPGPACYGKSDHPTVTDAHMALGHMGADTLLGGTFPVDPTRSVRAVQALGKTLGISPLRTARGILEVAEAHMVRALMVITVQRAVDPESLALVAFGGAGGLHVAGLVRRLGMVRGIVPADPGAFSAVGLALAEASVEQAESVLQVLDQDRERAARDRAKDLAAAARKALGGPGKCRVLARLRYVGQGATLAVVLGRRALRSAFEALHLQQYGFTVPDAEVELVELLARAERPPRPLPAPLATSSRRLPDPRIVRRSPLGGTRWKVYSRAQLQAGMKLPGPCLVEELTGVSLIPEGMTGVIHPLAILLG